MLEEITLSQWLGLSVVGALVAAIGSLIATIAKDFFFARSLERWKRHQDRVAAYDRFRDPLAASAVELANRLLEIINQNPTDYLSRPMFDLRPDRQIGNDASDPYYMHYKMVSTLYRFACFFGWLELYRQETTFLRIGDEKRTRELQEALTSVRSDIADGHINTHVNWEEWHDALIFREELRAIGEAMIEERGGTRSIMGYGRFRDGVEGDDQQIHRLCRIMLNFIADPKGDGRDFRHERLVRLLVHLVQLVRLIRPEIVTDRLNSASDKALDSQTAWPQPKIGSATA